MSEPTRERDSMATGGVQPLTGGSLWLAAIGLALCNFIVILDTTVTNVSVPHIAGGLAVSPSQGTWTITSYAVAEAITVPLSGWLSTRFGTLRTLLVALSGFGLFSMLCGFARSIELLVLMRVMQGLCGGPMMPMTQTLLLRIFPPEKLGIGNAVWGVTAISAPIFGPLAGGYISDNWSWPWIFFVNLPVVVLCFMIVSTLLRRYETERRPERIDMVGMVLLVLFVGSLQLVLDLGRERDWFASSIIVGLTATSLIAFAAFIVWELTDEHPVVDLRVLRRRSLAVGLPVLGLGFASMMGLLVLIPLWLQSVMGYTADDAGRVMALQGVLAVFAAPVVAGLMQKVDMRLLITGGMVWIATTAAWRTGWTTDAGFATFAWPQLMQGVGIPFFFITTMTLALTDVPPREVALAAGLLSFVRTVAGAAGTALATAGWDDATRVARGELVGTLHGVDQTAAQIQGSAPGNGAGLAIIERLVDGQAATIGTSFVFGVAAIAVVSSGLLVWFLPRRVGAGGPAPAH